jgi:hypothetical protein
LLRLDTTTPPGCSTVIAKAVARLTGSRGQHESGDKGEMER